MSAPATPVRACVPAPEADEGPVAESGRILLFTLGLVVVGLMLVGMVASATAVHLDHKRLDNLADLLATSAANATSPHGHLRDPSDSGPVLSDATVEEAVRSELAAYPFPDDLPPDLQVVEARTPEGRTARVTLAARSHPPLLAWFTRTVGDGFALQATASARTVVGG